VALLARSTPASPAASVGRAADDGAAVDDGAAAEVAAGPQPARRAVVAAVARSVGSFRYLLIPEP
jgi:hypothetical protein